MKCYTCYKDTDIKNIKTVETVSAKFLLCENCFNVFEDMGRKLRNEEE